MLSKADTLRQVSLFQLMDEAERASLASHVETLTYRKGEHVFMFGDPGDSLYIVCSGELEIYIKDTTGKRIVLEAAHTNDFFGELSLFDGGSRTASVVAVTDVELLIVNQSDLEELFRVHPSSALDFLAAMGKRMRTSANLLRQTASRNVNLEVEQEYLLIYRVADRVTAFSGSIACVVLHCLVFATWIIINIGVVSGIPVFDPYPFGLLTTVVSLEAIVLTVLVLLSQNRQAAKDRIRSDVEYDVNLKAELEISHLHEKIDHLHVQVLARLSTIEQSLQGGSVQKKVS